MFNNIQLLRAVAAVMVFVYHAVDHYRAIGGQQAWLLSFANFGFAGVDVFFVISGFVAAHSTLNKKRSLQSAIDFLRRRLLRIYLGYWPFCLLALIIAQQYSPEAMFRFDLLHSFFLTSTNMPVLLLPVSWSLTYELSFYVLVASMFALNQTTRKKLVWIACFGLTAMVLTTIGQRYTAVQGFASLTLEFLFGYWLYMYRNLICRSAWAIPLTAVVLIAFAAGTHWHATNDGIRIATFGLGAVALVSLAVCLESSRTFVANRFWTRLGDASYTIYLAQLPLISLFYFSGLGGLLAGFHPALRDLVFVWLLGLTLLACVVFYKHVEAPLYKRALQLTNRDVSLRVAAAQ